MRTSIGACHRKARFAALSDAQRAADRAAIVLRPYRCELCRQYHLTSRTKGMFAGRKCDKADP